MRKFSVVPYLFEWSFLIPYALIGPRAKRKREGEHVTIIVAGCVAQQEGAVLLRRAPYLYFVMGP